MALLTDLIDPQELVDFVRLMEFPDLAVLDDVLPNRRVEDIEYELPVDTRIDVNVSVYRGFDTEANIAKRQGTRRIRGRIPPISEKIVLGEETRLRLEAARSGNNDRIIEAIFDDAANTARAVTARVVLAKGQLLETGKVTLSENGVETEADFGVPGGHFVTAGASWATSTTSIVADLQTWQTTYREANNGLNPGGIIVSSKVLGYMLLNDEFRSLMASLAGAPALITRNSVDQILQAYSLPPIVKVLDTQVMVDDVAQRLIAEDRVVFVPPATAPLGATPWGITAEALELRSGGFIEAENLAGMVATVAKTEFDPVQTWTKSAALAIPMIGNPTRLFVADVVP